MQARSDYWGEIWVSLATKQIEYATINEEVNEESKLPARTPRSPSTSSASVPSKNRSLRNDSDALPP